MDVSAAGGLDLATMKALMSGATAVKQIDQSAAQSASLPTDALTLAMQSKVLDAAQGGLDVYA